MLVDLPTQQMLLSRIHEPAYSSVTCLQLADACAAADELRHLVEASRAEVHALLSSREGSSQSLRAQVSYV
jgi:hypothetical protein